MHWLPLLVQRAIVPLEYCSVIEPVSPIGSKLSALKGLGKLLRWQ